jgi:acetyl-CoA carboxylase biotin carboxylase subunit
MYKKILIANRGEIALRVIRACKEMGIETVAVFSEGDRGAQYLELADQAFCIGGVKSHDSYLKFDRIISAAEIGEAEAIHPGYGFLSENAEFNQVCRDSDFDFIGPTPEAMEMLGDKNQARELARKADVPVVPGSAGLVTDVDQAIKDAREIGYPILIKATAGGGGKGMRIAATEGDLKNAIEQAGQEAQAAFGNGGVYLEKFIDKPRHVEVQVLADHHGNVVHLWERDCSTQRRHQKLIEESPSSTLPADARAGICAAAVRMVKTANYHNAGTVEFIVDKDNNFYFIEVNARIQVEHPVSEMVTGIDLIQQQIRVAAGEKLSFSQDDIPCNGAAIECRINAENPDKNFMPSPGKMTQIHIPGGLGVRWDSHVHTGYHVPPHYDSMIGKLIVHQPTREKAIACMIRALDELRIEGISTTAGFLRKVLATDEFASGTIDTKWVEREMLAQ